MEYHRILLYNSRGYLLPAPEAKEPTAVDEAAGLLEWY